MAAPIRSSRKHRFFIKITISQYHDIDISYIDIDISKNAFSMTSLGISKLDHYCFGLLLAQKIYVIMMVARVLSTYLLDTLDNTILILEFGHPKISEFTIEMIESGHSIIIQNE